MAFFLLHIARNPGIYGLGWEFESSHPDQEFSCKNSESNDSLFLFVRLADHRIAPHLTASHLFHHNTSSRRHQAIQCGVKIVDDRPGPGHAAHNGERSAVGTSREMTTGKQGRRQATDVDNVHRTHFPLAMPSTASQRHAETLVLLQMFDRKMHILFLSQNRSMSACSPVTPDGVVAYPGDAMRRASDQRRRKPGRGPEGPRCSR